jgi:hypothetical protein
MVSNFPVTGSRFRPQHAYKALCKMALATMPIDELRHYRKLLEWIQYTDSALWFPILDVGVSVGALGKSPTIISASICRRVDPLDLVPYMIFIVSNGAVCLQIDLMSDDLEDHIPPIKLGAINVVYSIEDKMGSYIVRYSEPFHQNWSASDLRPQPLRRIVTEMDLVNGRGSWTLQFRS